MADHQNSERDIPVLLVVAGSKVNALPVVIQSLHEHTNFELFFVICPARDVALAQALAANPCCTIFVLNEEELIPELNIASVTSRLRLTLPNWPKNHLSGWYFQQFLKMGFSLKYSHYPFYLVWDADTVVTRQINFFEHGRIALTRSSEFHEDYFLTISALLPMIKIPTVSHISQHMMVDTQHMRELISLISCRDKAWWNAILENLTGSTPFRFSEYETYAAYCLDTYPSRYFSKARPWFRYGHSYFNRRIDQANICELADIYDFVAFETWDTPNISRRLRSHILVALNRFKSLFTSSIGSERPEHVRESLRRHD
jgi:hypothetical protein